MTKRSWIHLSAVMLLAIGCGSTQSQPAKPPPTPPAQASSCPMMMKDAQIAATDGEHDVTITFTTPGDPAPLRAHVREMGAMHDRMAHGGGMNGGGMGEHMKMVPSHAAVDDIDHGARIVLTPDDPAQLVALREHVHAQVEMMRSGTCPMMEGHEHGAQHDM